MNDTSPMIAPWRQWLRKSRLLVLFELALVAGVFIADEHHLVFFSKTPYLLALGWLSIAARGIGWRDLGLRLDGTWLRPVLIGIAAGALMEALELFVTQPLLVASMFNLVVLEVLFILGYSPGRQ